MTKSITLKIDDFSMDAIAESGQCFRIIPSVDSGTEKCKDSGADLERSRSFDVIAGGRLLKVTENSDGSFTFSCDKTEFDNTWRYYFDLSNDYQKYRDIVSDEDEYLRKAISFGYGIRILNQDPWEMLISFIISQRKSVPAIRTSVERLAKSFGKRIEGTMAYAFPAPEELAKATPEELSLCGLGYRVEYVRNASEQVLSGEFDIYGMRDISTEELIYKLMELKGVGIKVASCVALFGYHRLDTMPVDVWMKRVIDEVYGGSIPSEYAQYAGVLQQYMFNYARLNKGDFQGN